MVFYYSMILDAPVDDVWEVVSDCACCPAGAHHRQQRLSEGGGPKQVGTVRTNHFNDGTVGIEKLTELSDRHWRVVYDIIGGDPPVDGFTAVITVHEVSEDNRSFVAWSATFEVTGRRRRRSRLGPHRDLPDLPGRTRARPHQGEARRLKGTITSP